MEKYIINNKDGFVYGTNNYELAVKVAKDSKGKVYMWEPFLK